MFGRKSEVVVPEIPHEETFHGDVYYSSSSYGYERVYRIYMWNAILLAQNDVTDSIGDEVFRTRVCYYILPSGSYFKVERSTQEPFLSVSILTQDKVFDALAYFLSVGHPLTNEGSALVEKFIISL